MRTAFITAILAFAPIVCPACSEDQAAQAAPPQQEAKPAPAPAQEQKKTPQQISPLVPLGPAGSAAPAPGGTPKQPTAAPVSARTYVIGAEDIISVSVFENQSFSVAQQAVRVDGKITMPLLGEIMASDKTPEELAEEIQKILVERYMKEPPHVQVIVADVRSKNYYLQGEVYKPGKYPLVVPTTISQALINAGGFRDFANKKDIRIQRVGVEKFIKFNYVEVSKGKHMEQNIYLKPDDQIYVH
jgi:polysaccharide biosynthesis/export protein